MKSTTIFTHFVFLKWIFIQHFNILYNNYLLQTVASTCLILKKMHVYLRKEIVCELQNMLCSHLDMKSNTDLLWLHIGKQNNCTFYLWARLWTDHTRCQILYLPQFLDENVSFCFLCHLNAATNNSILNTVQLSSSHNSLDAFCF